jgi:hypothetical protein
MHAFDRVLQQGNDQGLKAIPNVVFTSYVQVEISVNQ